MSVEGGMFSEPLQTELIFLGQLFWNKSSQYKKSLKIK